MSKDTAIIVDPFSTGALIAPELEKEGIKCYAVQSAHDIPTRFTSSYTGEGFCEKLLYDADEIKNQINPEKVIAVIPGAETGVYCAEALASCYEVERNDPFTTDWRRKKSAMQERLKEIGLNCISSKRISRNNLNIDDLNSANGYVIKPDSSCLTDSVVFFDSKQAAMSWISQIDWEEKNIVGERNEYYLVQEKLNGEEFVVDLVVGKAGIKVCTLCKYKKGLHNGSHFVYESLEILDINDGNHIDLIEYAKECAVALGVEFGLAHLEIMNTVKGPILIELGARLHGGIAPLLFEKCYSPGLLGSIIKLITQQLEPTSSVLKKKGKIVFLINNKENFTINNIKELQGKISSVNGVEHVKLLVSDNNKIPLTIDLSNCPGLVSVVANSDNELNDAELKIRNIFQ